MPGDVKRFPQILQLGGSICFPTAMCCYAGRSSGRSECSWHPRRVGAMKLALHLSYLSTLC